MYLIFARWIAGHRVQWERPLPLRNVEHEHATRAAGTATCDLVVTTEDGDLWAVEAKWWQSASSKANGAILSDVAKLWRYEAVHKRVLLTFWYGGDVAEETDAVQKFFDGPVYPGLGVEVVWVGSFPMGATGRDFVMAALLITPRND